MRTVDDLLIEAFQARQLDLPERALSAFQAAAKLDPNDETIRLEIARCLLDLALLNEAVEALRPLGQNSEEEGEFLLELGKVWMRAEEVDRALHCWRRVGPESECFAPATMEIILLLERAHRLEEAEREWRQRTTLRQQPIRHFVEALLAEHLGAEEEAIDNWRRAVPGVLRSSLDLEAGYRLARLLDRRGENHAALSVLSRCKALERASPELAQLGAFVSERRAYDRAVLAKLTPGWFADRPAVSQADAVLILGHPRTGSSLTSRLLHARTGARWVDESPAFDVLARSSLQKLQVRSGPSGLVEFLASRGAEMAPDLQREYRRRLQAGATAPVEYLIDKNPGLSSSYPALHRLLPASAWLVMQRDPRDVALSCYFQRLGATPLGWSCLSLQGAFEAVFHALAYWQSIRALLQPEQFLQIRYEELVKCPEEVVTTVAERLDWHQQDSPAVMSQTPSLNLTPSFADVQRPVYQGAVARWKTLEQDLPRLTSAQARELELAGYATA